ncbi:unnamed protein product [Absidia cylindrospora]
MEYLAQYEDFLIKHAAQITTFESSLRSLTYLLPGRFHDAEFASQAVYAGLNLDSAFNKYLLFWKQRSKWNKTASDLLSILAYTQVLIEMGVRKKWGKLAQWQIIAFLEAIKVLLRLGLLQTTQNRMTLSPTHLQREVDPATLETRPENARTGTYQGERSGHEWTRMKDSFALDRRDTSDDIDAFLMSKVLTPEKLRQPPQMTHVLSSLGRLGEILYLLRPFIYVLCILKYGQRSWKPWTISVIVELGSQLALRKAFDGLSEDGHDNRMPLEKQEMSRRTQLIWFNLVRGAFYSRITRPTLEHYCNRLESKPLLNMAAGVLRDYLPLWESFYFYTSSS